MQRRAAIPKKQSSQQRSASNGNGSIAHATVVRRRCGTSPFDRHWLNLDCCGLFCAGITYWLHLYGCYAVCNVLIPPWMSRISGDGAEGKDGDNGDRKVCDFYDG